MFGRETSFIWEVFHFIPYRFIHVTLFLNQLRTHFLIFIITFMIKCYAYLSDPKKNYSSNEISMLVDSFIQSNIDHQITGFMVYDQQLFFQYIEGQPTEIEALVHNLNKDSRHQLLISASQIMGTRRFTDWNMKLLTANAIDRVVVENKLIDLMSFSYHNKEFIGDWESLAWRMINQIAKSASQLISIQ